MYKTKVNSLIRILRYVFIVGILFAFSSCSVNRGNQLQLSIEKAIEKSSSGVVSLRITYADSTAKNVVENDKWASGVIIDKSGTIVTTQSIVEGSNRIVVMFQDGCELNGTLVGSDFETNLAIITTSKHEHGCYPIVFKNNAASKVGEVSVILGYTPFTKGIAAGWGILSESWMGDGDAYAKESLKILQGGDNLTQIGFAVIDLNGQLLGICENYINGFNGVWTVIPSANIVSISKEIVQKGSVDRGWLGVFCHSFDEMSFSNGQKADQQSKALTVIDVLPESPAFIAGINSGDIIISANSKKIQQTEELREMITSSKAGEEIKIEALKSDGSLQQLSVKLGTIGDTNNRSRKCNNRSI